MTRNNPILTDLLKLVIAELITLLWMTGCKTAAPIAPLPSTHQRDSVRIEYRHDSIYTDRWHTIYTKGDTVYIHDSIWRDRFQQIHDTISLSTTDTIYTTVEVEKKGSAFLRNSGIALWVLLGILFLSVVLGIVLKFAK